MNKHNMWNGLRGLLRFRLRKLDANKQALVDLVGYVPNDWSLFECAFILKSMTRVSAQGVRLNNERLEYLGDAVLESVVSHYLYERYPTQSEGYLTASRSALVKRSTLNQVGKEMHLERWIKSDVNKLPDDAYGNVLESLIGAVYYDGGYEHAKAFIEDFLVRFLKVNKLLNRDANYKSQFIEICQKKRLVYRFELVDQQRMPDNSNRFQTFVYIGDKKCGEGVGTTKRESEQNAARHGIKVAQKMK